MRSLAVHIRRLRISSLLLCCAASTQSDVVEELCDCSFRKVLLLRVMMVGWVYSTLLEVLQGMLYHGPECK